MIATARTHKKLAATVLVGAFILGGGVSYEVNHNSNRVEENSHRVDEACKGANAANTTLLEVLRAAQAKTPKTPQSKDFYSDLLQITRSHIKSC